MDSESYATGRVFRYQDILELVASTDTGTSPVIVQLRESKYTLQISGFYLGQEQ